MEFNNFTALYYLPKNSILDNSIKYDLNKFNINLEYVTNLYELIANIPVKNPLMIIFDGEYCLNDIEFINLFSIKSPFFVPCVIIKTDKSYNLTEFNTNNILLVPKNFHINSISNLINNLIQKRLFYKNNEIININRSENISFLLVSLGITPKSIGHAYLKDCIYELLIKDCIALNFDSTIYIDISKKHHNTIGCLERSMRTAITMGWQSGLLQNRTLNGNKIFLKKPSIKEFIYMTAYYLRNKEIMQKLNQVANPNYLINTFK